MPPLDIQVNKVGTIAYLTALTKAGRAWLLDNVSIDAWQWHGEAVVTEPRYADGIADAAREDGLEVE